MSFRASATGRPGVTRPTVVYLAGSGRSGSTLLERILGGMPGFVNVGELIDVSRRVAAGNERCGCGEPFSECPFWLGVGKRAFGGWTSGAVDQIRDLQTRVARQRHIPRLLNPMARQGFRRDLARYRTRQADLYRAILTESGASWVVDASKWPAQALALAGPEIDLRVIHVVRDVRGVAFSMRKDVVRPQATSGTELMERTGTPAAAARWAVCQTEVDLVRLKSVPVARIRYEDLIRAPRPQISRALESIGLAHENGWLDHVGDQDVRLGASHGLSGNPSRFTEGALALRLDEAWRTELPRRDRLIATAIGGPHSLRHALTRHVPITSRRG